MDATKKLSKLAAWGTLCLVLGTANAAQADQLSPEEIATLQNLWAPLGIHPIQTNLLAQSINQSQNVPYTPVSFGGNLFSTGKDITVRVLPADAGYTSTLLYLVPELKKAGIVATNRNVGSVINIGHFDAGLEVIFGILVQNTGNFFMTGLGSRNLDGLSHATVNYAGPGQAIVGFEDLFGGGDRDYDDNMFEMSGGISNEPVPEPTTILGTLAFSTFAARWRMKRKQQQKSLDSKVV
jgi:hypothetical protein